MNTVPRPGTYTPPQPGTPAAHLLYRLFTERIIAVQPSGPLAWETAIETIAHASRYSIPVMPASLVVPDIPAAEEAAARLVSLGVPASIRSWVRPAEVTQQHHNWHTMMAHVVKTSPVPTVHIWPLTRRHTNPQIGALGASAVHPDVDLSACPPWPSPATQLLVCSPIGTRALDAARSKLTSLWMAPDQIPLEVILAGGPQ